MCPPKLEVRLLSFHMLHFYTCPCSAARPPLQRACRMCRAAPHNPHACVFYVHPTVSTVVMVSVGACSDLTLLEAVRPELLLCRDFAAAANKSHVTLKTLKLVTRLKNPHVVTCHNSVTRLWVMTMSSPLQICISVGGAGSDCDNLHRWQIAIYYDVCIYTLKIYI